MYIEITNSKDETEIIPLSKIMKIENYHTKSVGGLNSTIRIDKTTRIDAKETVEQISEKLKQRFTNELDFDLVERFIDTLNEVKEILKELNKE